MVARIFYCIIIVYNILSSLMKKTLKIFIGRKKKKKAGSMYIPVLWDANYDHENDD